MFAGEKAKPVLTKRDFLKRFRKGEFGNRGLMWESLSEYQLSGYQGLVHLRNRIAGGETIYNIPSDRVAYHWNQKVGANSGRYFLAAMAPHEKNLIQGEVQRTSRGLEMFYSLEKGLPMRDALASQPRTTAGIMSVCLLKTYLCPNSYDWLMELLDIYDGHVVEFSCFDCNWGTLPHYNTVFWEIRNY